MHAAFPHRFHELEVPACRSSLARPFLQRYCGFLPFSIPLQHGQERVFNYIQKLSFLAKCKIVDLESIVPGFHH